MSPLRQGVVQLPYGRSRVASAYWWAINNNGRYRSLRLGDILRLAAQRDPRKTAIIAEEYRISFADYDTTANRFAHLLLDAGIQKGDHRHRAVQFARIRRRPFRQRVLAACWSISPMYAGPEIARIVERTRPRILVIDVAIEQIAQVRDRMVSVEN